VHQHPSAGVQQALSQLQQRDRFDIQDLYNLPGFEIQTYPVDLYFYLEPTAFRPVESAAVRLLTPDDASQMASLHAGVEENRRWYVELDHPVVFGCFDEGELVAAASHFLFEEYHVAAPGVMTHRAYRQRGFGAAVVSAAVIWALERNWIVEWCTNERNLCSMGIAKRLGFSRFATETEIRVRVPELDHTDSTEM